MPMGWKTKNRGKLRSKGLTRVELWSAEPQDAKATATRNRNAALQTFGNLTILTQALNSAASNSAWSEKKVELLQHSLLPINQQLHSFDTWNEETIADRANVLLKRALELWPRI